MGRWIGRRPDPTPRIARSVRRFLDPGERVIAAVDVQTPGTTAAAMRAGTTAGVSTAVGEGVTAVRMGGGDAEHRGWLEHAERFGVDLSRRVVWVSLVLTPARLLLVRRALVTRRLHMVLAAWPVLEIDGVQVPRNGARLVVQRGDLQLPLELPHVHRFLPDVYRRFPDLLAGAQTEARVGSREPPARRCRSRPST